MRWRLTGSVERGATVHRRPARDRKGGAELFGFVAAGLGIHKAPRAGRTVTFPAHFSFIENPDETVEALARLAAVSRSRPGGVVHLNQSPCTLLDYGAEAVAGVIARAARDGLKVRFDGMWPQDADARDMAAAAGLPKLMDAPVPDLPGVFAFPLHHGRKRPPRPHASDERDRVATTFSFYLDECLRRHGIGFSETGLGRVLGLVGEVINNSEDHGQRPDWWIGGYLRKITDDYGDCHVVLFNFGETVYESMQRLPTGSLLRRQIDSLTERHVRSGFFGTAFGKEDLWTLYALQAGASRHQTSADELNTSRGQGLADMITLFQEIGGTTRAGAEPRMCLVSGRTYIRFNPSRYAMRERPVEGGEPRRIIAFNDGNDLEKPPDGRNVRRLRTFFPGTVISLSLYLDRMHLRTLPPLPPEDGHV